MRTRNNNVINPNENFHRNVNFKLTFVFLFFRWTGHCDHPLRELFQINRELKEKLKDTVTELTENLQQELKNTQIKNERINLENRKLKNKLAKYK